MCASAKHQTPKTKRQPALNPQTPTPSREAPEPGFNFCALPPCPYALVPFYRLCERWPATREDAHRLGLVTLRQMIFALVPAVKHPPEQGARVWDVPRPSEIAAGA